MTVRKSTEKECSCICILDLSNLDLVVMIGYGSDTTWVKVEVVCTFLCDVFVSPRGFCSSTTVSLCVRVIRLGSG
ncbi:unnamed protein product [Sphenostylis stenocarpa]|uniref:Uncharacterized protein n=1 Tax=Sphenostylis stenocarpa TaxID=92480 RepID=A0AA86VG85_9FABA|nr:unnamed protein product [Sphenostylis stenocarpa]